MNTVNGKFKSRILTFRWVKETGYVMSRLHHVETSPPDQLSGTETRTVVAEESDRGRKKFLDKNKPFI